MLLPARCARRVRKRHADTVGGMSPIETVVSRASPVQNSYRQCRILAMNRPWPAGGLPSEGGHAVNDGY